MSVDIVKQLEKAKRFVEKSRIDEAIEAYQSVLSAVPNHLESMQSLGDLFTMQNRPDRAAVYYGMLFDHFTAPREEPKAARPVRALFEAAPAASGTRRAIRPPSAKAKPHGRGHRTIHVRGSRV